MIGLNWMISYSGTPN